MGFEPEDFRERVTGDGINLTPNTALVRDEGYLISTVQDSIPVSTMERLKHVLITDIYEVSDDKKKEIYLKIGEGNTFAVGKYYFDVDKYRYIHDMLRSYGISIYTRDSDGELTELTEEGIIFTAKLTHKADISSLIGV